MLPAIVPRGDVPDFSLPEEVDVMFPWTSVVRKAPGRVKRARPASAKLSLEGLENRCLLAVPNGHVLDLDGLDDYATALDRPALDLGAPPTTAPSDDNFTIEGFFYVPASTGESYSALISKPGAYSLAVDFNSGTPDRVEFKLNGFTGSSPDTRTVPGNLELAAGWHHFAGVYDENGGSGGSDTISLYVDGSRRNTINVNWAQVSNSSSSLYVGEWGSSPSPNRYSGQVDEVRLSRSERYAGTSYTVPTDPFPLDSSTVALWHFNEPVGSTSFADASGNGITLTGVSGARTAFPTWVPEIEVLNGTAGIADNTGSADFGSTPVGTSISRMFTVRNTGSGNLTLVPPISVPAGFTLTSSFGSTTVAPGGSTNFTVRFNAAAAGTSSGQLSFGTNDGDENPFNFTVTATATTTSNVLTATNLASTAAAANLVTSLLGPGVAVSNVSFRGVIGGGTTQGSFSSSAGTFSGGTSSIGFDQGVIISSGGVQNVLGPNDSDFITQENGLPGDAALDALVGGGTQDATVLEFDFVPTQNSISFQYVFASDEYNEFANSNFNDAFAFFLNGNNIALLSDGSPVTINNVNAFDRPDLFRNNDLSDGGGSIPTEMDGLTLVFTVQAAVIPNQVNHIKLAIADTGDPTYDSNVFIRTGSFASVGGDIVLPDYSIPNDPNDPNDDSFVFIDGTPSGPLDPPTVYDPPVAVGYDYVVTSGPNFASVTLPDGFTDGQFSVHFDTDPVTPGIQPGPGIPVTGGVTFSFLANGHPAGVAAFQVQGIEPGAGVDPSDALGFPTGLNFVTSSPVTFTMTPIVIDFNPDPPSVVDVWVEAGGVSYSLVGNDRVLPWTTINTIKIKFDQDVHVDANDLVLAGVSVPGYAFSSFSYDPVTFVATWVLAVPVGADRLTLNLNGSGSGGVASTAGGTLLDGGDLVLAFSVLPGDFNGDGTVTIEDSTRVRGYSPGFGDYWNWADLDGDGDVDLDDINSPRRRLGWRLP